MDKQALDALARIESKLDALIDALAEDDEPEQSESLDGTSAGRERDAAQSL